MKSLPRETHTGPHFLVGFEGTAWSAELRDFFTELRPSGVVLFRRNIIEPHQVAALNRDIQTFSHAFLGRGMFIGIDHEGGRVQRIRAPLTALPAARSLADGPNPESEARRFAGIAARELRLAGFNLNFVPVLDTLASADRASDNVIGDRSFGHDPDFVARMGCAIIKEMRAAGVIPCAKHFPGHGSAEVDSHVQLPEDPRPKEVLLERDLLPFRAAVATDVEMMMTAHVVYPALDSVMPATLSRPALTGLLRGSMAYGGVTVTDDLDMGAIRTRHSIADAAVRAFEAGADLILICNSPYAALEARVALDDRMRRVRGEAQDHEAASLRRIEALRRSYADSMRPCETSTLSEYLAAATRSGSRHRESSR
jgi:beta-N-acetylhexosaminidase